MRVQPLSVSHHQPKRNTSLDLLQPIPIPQPVQMKRTVQSLHLSHVHGPPLEGPDFVSRIACGQACGPMLDHFIHRLVEEAPLDFLFSTNRWIPSKRPANLDPTISQSINGDKQTENFPIGRSFQFGSLPSDLSAILMPCGGAEVRQHDGRGAAVSWFHRTAFYCGTDSATMVSQWAIQWADFLDCEHYVKGFRKSDNQ